MATHRAECVYKPYKHLLWNVGVDEVPRTMEIITTMTTTTKKTRVKRDGKLETVPRKKNKHILNLFFDHGHSSCSACLFASTFFFPFYHFLNTFLPTNTRSTRHTELLSFQIGFDDDNKFVDTFWEWVNQFQTYLPFSADRRQPKNMDRNIRLNSTQLNYYTSSSEKSILFGPRHTYKSIHNTYDYFMRKMIDYVNLFMFFTVVFDFHCVHLGLFSYQCDTSCSFFENNIVTIGVVWLICTWHKNSHTSIAHHI